MIKTLVHISLVTLVLLLGQPAQIFASAVNRPMAGGTEDTLRAIAEASVAAQNQVLVTGDIKGTLENDPLAPFYRDAIWDRLVYAQNQQAALAAHRLGYMSFNTQWTVNDTELAGVTATVKATEYTVLKFDVANVNHGSPPTTEYVQEHIFTFISREGQWTLVSDQLLNIPGPSVPTAEERAIGPVPSNPLSLDRPINPEAQLNRNAIVSYAYTYWQNYNPSYRRFDNYGQGGDCTNFVSQALRAGGWPDVTGWYQSTSAWWYNYLNQTYTWINAHYWWWFTHDRPRGFITDSDRNLLVGDILQIDFNRDGYIDHSMIVTYKDSNDLYLTYHTNDTLNRPLSSIYSQYPTAIYHYWRLYDYFN
jgi:hypothetical protein